MFPPCSSKTTSLVPIWTFFALCCSLWLLVSTNQNEQCNHLMETTAKTQNQQKKVTKSNHEHSIALKSKWKQSPNEQRTAIKTILYLQKSLGHWIRLGVKMILRVFQTRYKVQLMLPKLHSEKRVMRNYLNLRPLLWGMFCLFSTDLSKIRKKRLENVIF